MTDGVIQRPSVWFFPLPSGMGDVIYDAVITGNLLTVAFTSMARGVFRDDFCQRPFMEAGPTVSVRYPRTVCLDRLGGVGGQFQCSSSSDKPTVTCVSVDVGDARKADCRPVLCGYPFESDVWDPASQCVRLH